MGNEAAELAQFLRKIADEVEAKGIDEGSVALEWTRDMLITPGVQKYRDTGVRNLTLSFRLLGGYRNDEGAATECLNMPVVTNNPALWYPLQPVAISASDVRARIAELEAERGA